MYECFRTGTYFIIFIQSMISLTKFIEKKLGNKNSNFSILYYERKSKFIFINESLKLDEK